MERADYRAVLRDAQELRRALVRAYAVALPPRPGEFRGVWNHTGTGLYPGDWPRTCRLLAESGVTAVFPNLLWAGVAHYPSRVLPSSDVHRLYGDQLRQSSEAARAAGLELHLWKVCWNLGAVPATETARLQKAGRLQRTDTGAVLPWLCPSHPANMAQELAAIDEAARSGLVDGIHLDYVRYPGPQACFCDNCRSDFERWLGRAVPDWPAAARHGNLADRYQEWRCRQITEFVRQVRGRLARHKGKIRLSAAVYQGYPACRASVGQDWGAWLEAGLVDFLTPMNYTENAAEFTAVLAAQTGLPGAAGRIYPGLGVTASESRLLPDQVMEQILRLRALNCAGFILFDLNPTLAEETLPVLRLSVYGR
ncbi:MAG: family 10 glycosylhydrolase, partial [Lentisphaerae bacterium]|nr:family 10 glycosylhydrolase [Lentisphaerota bacterium]